MAKRKRGSRPVAQSDGPNLDVGPSKLRIRDYGDVAGSDDEFHIQRDKVLLEEEPDAKRRRKVAEDEEFLQPSDEVVLDYSEEDEDEQLEDEYQQQAVDSEDDDDDGAAEEQEEGGWGTSKADLYGADEIETEEQALEEEQEALRLQKRQLQAMTAADYGFDEADWQAGAEDEEQAEDVVTEVLPQLQVTDDMGPAERLKLLKQRYPEFEPLSKEWLALQERHPDLVQQARAPNACNAIAKLRAASAYLGALTMYFSLLTSPAAAKDADADAVAMSATKLRDHPVMDSLMQCRDLWQRVQDMPADVQAATLSDDDSDWEKVPAIDLEAETNAKAKRRQRKLSRAEKHAAAAQSATEARRAERLERADASLADLDALVASSRKASRPSTAIVQDDSDLGEEAPLTARQAAEKAQRKKSLRFYTSQIAQKANKRGASGRNAGGDEDVPYRERLKDRQARLNAEAEKRGKHKSDIGDDLGGESDDEDRKQAKAIRDEAADDEYYDMVASRTAKKKSDKAAFAAAQKRAELEGGRVVEEEVVGPDGKRGISYAIEKNKGLTPHRKKDVRNPRVKKRKKFEQKNKKLASMKPVYKGGEGRGGYGGELTGIKKGLVKSTKL